MAADMLPPGPSVSNFTPVLSLWVCIGDLRRICMEMWMRSLPPDVRTIVSKYDQWHPEFERRRTNTEEVDTLRREVLELAERRRCRGSLERAVGCDAEVETYETATLMSVSGPSPRRCI